MLPKSGNTSSRTGVISVITIFIFIIILVIFFTTEKLGALPGESSPASFYILPASAIIITLLAVSVVVSTRRLVRDRRRNKPGARLKTKLVLFFLLIAMLSAVPQSLVSLRFINTAIRSWFSPEIGSGIEGGLKLALEYYNNELETLQGFAEGPMLETILAGGGRPAARVWQDIKNTAPWMDSVQIFTESGQSVFFGGNPEAGLSAMPSTNNADGMLPRENLRDISLIRYMLNYRTSGTAHYMILSVILPEDLDGTAGKLSRAREVFLHYQQNNQEFTILLYLFYLLFSLPLILISILISIIISGEIIQPIVSLDEATRKVAEGEYSYRILARSSDELSNLIKSFNLMTEELEKSRMKLLQTEKITAWQEIARQLAHELKNPLTPIKLSAERLLRKYQRDPENLGQIIEKSISSIISEVNTLDNLLREFRDFSKLPTPYPEKCGLKAIVEECAASYRTSFPGIDFDTERIDPDLILFVDPAQFRRVFSNLFKNACEAIESDYGSISVQTDLVRKGNSSYCRIRVRDSGTGIDRKDYEQVFNPYFTTKNEGSGLGLPIVERIIFDHKGQIWFETEKGHGTTFFIDLPMEN